MDLSAVRALVLEINFDVHGLPASVEVKQAGGGFAAAVETRAIWLTTESPEMPIGGTFQRRDPVRVMALRRDEVPHLPRGSRITAPEKAGDLDAPWIVDAHERREADHQRVVVLPEAGTES